MGGTCAWNQTDPERNGINRTIHKTENNAKQATIINSLRFNKDSGKAEILKRKMGLLQKKKEGKLSFS
jgi:hypothetical protein